MSDSRLALALAAGALHLPPEGPIALIRPPGDLDLSALPAGRLVAMQGFRPDHDALAARGVAVAPGWPASAAAAIVFVPRAKALARDLLARALTLGGPVIVDGQKTDGVDSLLRDLRGRVSLGPVYAKAHGKCAQFTAPPEALADWRLPGLARGPSGWVTGAGLFSADAPDPGSVALADVLPPLAGRVADLGAGWGYLAAQVLRHPGVAECTLIEAEHDALEAARANVPDPRARFVWADARLLPASPGFDHVVSNPPFHHGRRADPGLGQAFIAAAARVLAPRGVLWLVANRHLPYEATLEQCFSQRSTLAESGGYKLIEARHPRRQTPPRPRR